MGMKISSKKMKSAIEKLMIRKWVEILMVLTKLNVKSPTQEVSGPGITGRKLPTIPRKIKNPEIQINRRSISFTIDLER